MEIKRESLLDVLQKVAPGLDENELISQSASFVFTEGKVFTYNDEIAVGHLVDLDIEGAVSSKELLQLLRRLKTDTVEIKVKNNEFLINSKRLRSGITMESKILLPIDELKDGWEQEVYALPDKFIEGIKICLSSCAADTENIILSNVHMKGEFMEGCDNYQMTRFYLGEDSQENLLIPAVACKHLVNYKVTEYFTTDGWIHFGDGEDLIFSCRVIEDKYPDFDQFLEIEGPETTLPKGLIEVIDRSNVFNQKVQINILKNWCKVRAQSEAGWFEERIRIKEKRDIDFRINSNMLKEILKVMNKLTIGKNALRFDMEEFIHVIALEKS